MINHDKNNVGHSQERVIKYILNNLYILSKKVTAAENKTVAIYCKVNSTKPR